MRRDYRNHQAAVAVLIIFSLFIGIVPAFSGEPAAPAGSGSSVWGADYFPNIPLVTHTGKTLRFYDDVIKGKVVAINFIYTNCPDMCALETARLREVQRILGDRVGRDVFIYSITIDPEFDTPAALRAYAKRYQHDPKHWSFLTGPKDRIMELARESGMSMKPDEGLLTHNFRTLIVDPAGKLQMSFPVSGDISDGIVSELLKALKGGGGETKAAEL